MDGVLARTPKTAAFNNGNLSYELQIRSNTLLSILGKYNLEQYETECEVEKVEFSDILNTSTRIGKFSYPSLYDINFDLLFSITEFYAKY